MFLHPSVTPLLGTIATGAKRIGFTIHWKRIIFSRKRAFNITNIFLLIRNILRAFPIIAGMRFLLVLHLLVLDMKCKKNTIYK